MSTDSLERIHRLLERLVEIAPWWAGWWTPVPDHQLADFERAHGVVLPSAHRQLLIDIGEPAPIPGRPRGGLIRLAQALVDTPASDLLGPLAQPFIGAGDGEVDLEWDDDDEDPPFAGCLPVLDAGDSIYLLIITGSERGRVWSYSPSSAPPLRSTGAKFLDWYAAELERGMTPLEADVREREALEQRVANDPEDLAASVTLGRRLLLIDRARARELLERAWTAIDSLEPSTQLDLRRAIAELDLLDGRSDRLASMPDVDADPWLRTYSGIAAARAGDHEQAIARLEGAKIPVLLRSAAIGHLARAHAAHGRFEHALALLRSTQASTSNHAIAARLREAMGDQQAAQRSWAEARAAQDRSRTGPRPPRLADLLEAPVSASLPKLR